MDWNFIQQVLRYVMAYVGTYLVAKGLPNDLVTAAGGGVVSLAGLLWWWVKFRNAAPPEATTPPVVEVAPGA